MLPLLIPFITGCTGLLWDKNTFGRNCRPATPANLVLFYSAERKDLLVQYDEKRDHDKHTHRRCYWLDRNAQTVRNGGMPRFVPFKLTKGLDPVPRFPAPTNPPPASLNGLYAVAPRENDRFTLYVENKELESYGLPEYKLASGTAAKVLLTPVAVAGDATLVGLLLAAQTDPDSDNDLTPPHRKKPKPK